MSLADVDVAVAAATVSVGVAESSPLVADALVNALQDNGLDAAPVTSEDDVDGIDVLLADARLDPIHLARLAKAVDSRPGCRLVLVCAHRTKVVLTAGRQLGAAATFDRSRSVAELVVLVRHVAGGHGQEVEVEVEQDGPASLTSRELQILEIISAGATNDDVASVLGISPHTVRSHLGNILGKLGVTGRLGAVTAVREAGLLPHPRSAPR